MPSTHGAPPSTETKRPAQFRTFWIPPDAAFVGVRGDLDMRNASEFVEYAWRAGKVENLIIDLSECAFFGSAGFAALDQLRDRCAVHGIRWALVPSRTVRRVVDICDENFHMTMHPTVESARVGLAHSS